MLTVAATFAGTAAIAQTQGKKLNIVVTRTDDVGIWNISAYHRRMGGRTPNIDRIAKEGALFTDYYAQQHQYCLDSPSIFS